MTMQHASKYPAINTELGRADRLFTAIMILDSDQINALKKEGVSLTEEIKNALIHGAGRFHPRNPAYCFWDRLCCDFGCLPPKEFAKITSLLRAETGVPIFYSPLLFKRCENCLTNRTAFEAVLLNFNLKRITKADIMKIIIDGGAADCLPLCEKSGWLKKPEVRDELIEYSGGGKSAECAAFLLDFKNRTANPAKEQRTAEKRLERELNADPDSPSELKKQWSFKKQEDGTLIITGYKGDRTEIDVPAKIGEDKVTAIGEGAFSPFAKRLKAGPSTFRKIIKRVTLPDTVTSVGIRAFFKCFGLTELVIPESVTYIDGQALFGCGRLTVTVVKGSCGEEYCKNNNIPCKYKE